MACWPIDHPLPDSLPQPGERGSFWEPRGDRYHAGVDLYAPAGTPVLAITGGVVAGISIFTRQSQNIYWNQTYSIVVQSGRSLWIRYAELGDVTVSQGDHVQSGQRIGSIGQVLSAERIDYRAPLYIQQLGACGIGAMLHLEMHRQPPLEDDSYLGGNYFRSFPPAGLLDPTVELVKVLQEKRNLSFT